MQTCGSFLLQSLGHALHSRERLIQVSRRRGAAILNLACEVCPSGKTPPVPSSPSLQECVGLIRRVCVDDATGAELTNKLTEHLKQILSDNEVRASAPSCP